MIDLTVPTIATDTIYMPSHVAVAMLGNARDGHRDLTAHDAATMMGHDTIRSQLAGARADLVRALPALFAWCAGTGGQHHGHPRPAR